MRTDVVRVYVHAGGASTGQRADMKVLEKAALEFLGALDRMLGVSPQ